MVVSAVTLDQKQALTLAAYKIRDSKKVSPSRRRSLVSIFTQLVTESSTVYVSADELDAGRAALCAGGERLAALRAKKQKNGTMNTMTYSAFVRALRALKTLSRVHTLYVDAFANDKVSLAALLQQDLPSGINIVVEHKADERYLAASCASIVAKTARDAAIDERIAETGIDFGSGYSADTTTQRWVAKWSLDTAQLPSNLLRHSFEPKEWLQIARNAESKVAQQNKDLQRATGAKLATSGARRSYSSTTSNQVREAGTIGNMDEPVIIRQTASQWPLVNDWSIDRLVDVEGETDVPCELSIGDADYRDLDADGGGSQHRTFEADVDVPLAVLAEHIRAVEDDDGVDERLYLAQKEVDVLPTIAKLVPNELPVLLANTSAPARTEIQRKIWLGPRGTKSPLHRDMYHNFFVQIWGVKKFLIFPPEATPHLHPYTDNYFLRHTSSLRDLSSVMHLAREVTLEPGDALYLPKKTWHYVESVKGSLSVSYWW